MTRAEGVGEPVEEEVGVTGENRLGGGGNGMSGAECQCDPGGRWRD